MGRVSKYLNLTRLWIEIIKISLLLILFTQNLGFYNKGWCDSLSLSKKTIKISIHHFSGPAPLPFKTLPLSPIFCLIDDTCQITYPKVQNMSCKTHFLSHLFLLSFSSFCSSTTTSPPKNNKSISHKKHQKSKLIKIPKKIKLLNQASSWKIFQKKNSKIPFSRFEIPRRNLLVLRIFSSRGFLSSWAQKFQIFVASQTSRFYFFSVPNHLGILIFDISIAPTNLC